MRAIGLTSRREGSAASGVGGVDGGSGVARIVLRGGEAGRAARSTDRQRALLQDAAPVLASPAPGVVLPGVLSRGLLDAVAGGQPLLLHQRGRLRAVLIDADSWAELEALAENIA